MKAAPAAPFILAKAQFLFEVLIVPLDPPTKLGRGHQRATAVFVAGSVDEKVLDRFGFACGPFNQAPLLGTAAWSVRSRDGPGRTRTAAKRDASLVLVPSCQVTRRQACLGKARASCLAETG